jgi:hypothetical protein
MLNFLASTKFREISDHSRPRWHLEAVTRAHLPLFKARAGIRRLGFGLRCLEAWLPAHCQQAWCWLRLAWQPEPQRPRQQGHRLDLQNPTVQTWARAQRPRRSQSPLQAAFVDDADNSMEIVRVWWSPGLQCH